MAQRGSMGQGRGDSAEYLKKGAEACIEGKLIHRSYENSAGEKRYVTEINMNELLMFGGKK